MCFALVASPLFPVFWINDYHYYELKSLLSGTVFLHLWRSKPVRVKRINFIFLTFLDVETHISKDVSRGDKGGMWSMNIPSPSSPPLSLNSEGGKEWEGGECNWKSPPYLMAIAFFSRIHLGIPSKMYKLLFVHVFNQPLSSLLW